MAFGGVSLKMTESPLLSGPLLRDILSRAEKTTTDGLKFNAVIATMKSLGRPRANRGLAGGGKGLLTSFGFTYSQVLDFRYMKTSDTPYDDTVQLA